MKPPKPLAPMPFLEESTDAFTKIERFVLCDPLEIANIDQITGREQVSLPATRFGKKGREKMSNCLKIKGIARGKK